MLIPERYSIDVGYHRVPFLYSLKHLTILNSWVMDIFTVERYCGEEKFIEL
jgi:hypothetical protein